LHPQTFKNLIMDHQEIDKLTIGEIVSNDFRASGIFKNVGIDFCCGGNQLLGDACAEFGIEKDSIIKEIQSLENEPISQSLNFRSWEPGFLCDYIVNTHHMYVVEKMPELGFYTEKIATVHGDHHPELVEVADLFKKIITELTQHLKNEEEVLFPAIKDIVATGSESAGETIKSEILRMKGEHEFAGGAMDEINRITNNYSLPEDACNTYQVTFKMLEQFEDDLHVHVHLENNILFPTALKLSN